MSTCPVCGRPVRSAGVGRPAVYCGDFCARKAATQRRSALIAAGRAADGDSAGALLSWDLDAMAANERQREADVEFEDAALWQASKTAGRGSIMLITEYLKTGKGPKRLAERSSVASKASLVEDAAGEVLIPTDLVVDILDLARSDDSKLRSLASVRPTTRSKQRVGLLSAAATGWGRLETGTTVTDASIAPVSPADEIEVHDLNSLAKIGMDELDDTPESARQAIVECFAEAVGESEDNAFAAGTGSDQPSGLALAANVARIPAGQKTTAVASATPVTADILALPFKLPARYMRNARWLMSVDAAAKVATLTYTNGDALMPNPGQGIGPLGWPLTIVPGLPAMSTAGVTDPSIFFGDIRAAYRIVDRQRMTIRRLTQRFAELGVIGVLVRHRIGGDLVRPSALCVYLL